MKELKRLLPYLVKYKKKLLWGLLFVLIANVGDTIIPRIVGKAIDSIVKGNFTDLDILRSIGLMLGLGTISGIFMYLTRRTVIVSSRLIEYDLRNDLLLALEKMPQEYFHKNSTGSLMAYSTNDIAAARDFLGPAIMYAANTLTTFVF